MGVENDRSAGSSGYAVPIKTDQGELLEAAIPSVSDHQGRQLIWSPVPRPIPIAKSTSSHNDRPPVSKHAPLAGSSIEGLDALRHDDLGRPRKSSWRGRIYCGMPVVRVGRGNTEGFVPVGPPFIGGSQSHRNQSAAAADGLHHEVWRLPAAGDPDQSHRPRNGRRPGENRRLSGGVRHSLKRIRRLAWIAHQRRAAGNDLPERLGSSVPTVLRKARVSGEPSCLPWASHVATVGAGRLRRRITSPSNKMC